MTTTEPSVMDHVASMLMPRRPAYRRTPRDLSSWKTLACVLASIFFTAACYTPSASAPLAKHTVLESVSATRGRIVLNGLWGFEPVLDSERPEPRGNWGTVFVPGSWTRSGSAPIFLPGIQQMHEAWEETFNGTIVDRAWYVREFEVPAGWADRAIVLELARVSTDAAVYINGHRVGDILWPGGEVDVTGKARVGMNSVLIDTVAQQTSDYVANLMGSGATQRNVEKAQIKDKGLIGDVILKSRPKGPHISDVFVIPSTRKKQITLDVEFSDVRHATALDLTARMLNGDTLEKTFNARVRVSATERQRVRLTFDWKEPRLWDIGKPELYTLQLMAEGGELRDEYAQGFGFREFWIEGTNMMLNGSVFKPRPVGGTNPWVLAGTNAEAVRGLMDGFARAGFNVVHHWPSDDLVRGSVQFRELWYEEADKRGVGNYGVTTHFGMFISDPTQGWRYVWDEPSVRARFVASMQSHLRRIRNHPSVLMWGAAGNYFGSSQDQNPRFLGMKWAGTDRSNRDAVRVREAAGEAIQLIREFDPTRPVFVHQGALGSCHTTNHYMNFIPLQEREEWLTHYADHAEMPWFPGEFGTPLYYSYSRGRNGFNTLESEPWLTEFGAIYFGNAAFELETDEYRALVADTYQGGGRWQNWNQNREPIDNHPLAWELQKLFIENTWRSWRTTGATAGILPWDWVDMLWKEQPAGPLAYEEIPFVPGREGAYYPQLPNSVVHFLDPRHGFVASPAGRALIANNQATLAWIAGPQDTPTAKDSRFWASQAVDKSLALHNDTRSVQPYTSSWVVRVAGQEVARGEQSGKLGISSVELVPIRFDAPTIRDIKAEGVIEAKARIGDSEHTDKFSFRVFAKQPELKLAVNTIDPVGKTTKMLHQLGVATEPWDGSSAERLIVIGREALSAKDTLPVSLRNLEQRVRAGARVLIFSQHPEWLRRHWGFRVNRFPARRVFRIDTEHPVVAGLDDRDLANFAGESTLVEAKPKYELGKVPAYGWHWGNRGAVSSAALEKPHRSGWRPLLETEFDLQYSPLMELAYGKGRVVLAMLDLEERVAREPAAWLLATQTLQHAASPTVHESPEAAVYIGGPGGKAALDATGVEYKTLLKVPTGTKLLVLGEDAAVPAATLEGLARGGTSVLVLARQEGGKHFGVQLKQQAAFAGSRAIARWPELAGLSPSDLRLKVAMDYTLVDSGAELMADGMFARRKVGAGIVLYAQVDPTALDTRTKSYLRLTAWRQTRALSQVLANLGARFHVDESVFRIRSPQRVLAGSWQAAFTNRLDASSNPRSRHDDPGVSRQALAVVRSGGSGATTTDVTLPGMLSAFGDADGEIVVQTTFELSEDWVGKAAVLKLGKIDDGDTTYMNGVEIGSTASSMSSRNQRRLYRIPPEVLRAGKNTLAVRIFDAHGEGGIEAKSNELVLLAVPDESDASLYSTDYRSDHELGDEPYRYYRW